MKEKEIEIFNEFKDFLEAWNNGDISTGDSQDCLQDFYDRLKELEN
jgi:hypothetical protein